MRHPAWSLGQNGRVPTAAQDQTAQAKSVLRAELRARRARAAATRPPTAQGVRRETMVLVDAFVGAPRGAGRVAGRVAGSGAGRVASVACYVSFGDEPETGDAVVALHEAGYEVLLPVLTSRSGPRWGVYRGEWSLGAPGAVGPRQPLGASEGPQALSRARLVLVPALAVDDHGTRLGRGGGWYDRALAHVDPAALVVAVVHDGEAHHPRLPRAPHDLPVRGVLTPREHWAIAPTPFAP